MQICVADSERRSISGSFSDWLLCNTAKALIKKLNKTKKTEVSQVSKTPGSLGRHQNLML